VHGGGDDAEGLGRLGDGDELAFGWDVGGLVAGDVPGAAQAADPRVKGSPVAVRRPCRLRMPAMVASG
jgi:hypothetical protein